MNSLLLFIYTLHADEETNNLIYVNDRFVFIFKHTRFLKSHVVMCVCVCSHSMNTEEEEENGNTFLRVTTSRFQYVQYTHSLTDIYTSPPRCVVCTATCIYLSSQSQWSKEEQTNGGKKEKNLEMKWEGNRLLRQEKINKRSLMHTHAHADDAIETADRLQRSHTNTHSDSTFD